MSTHVKSDTNPENKMQGRLSTDLNSPQHSQKGGRAGTPEELLGVEAEDKISHKNLGTQFAVFTLAW